MPLNTPRLSTAMVVSAAPAPVKRMPAPVSARLPLNATTSLLLIEGSYAIDSGPMPAGDVPGPAIVTNAPFLARITESKLVEDADR